jgi:hypothetical protein
MKLELKNVGAVRKLKLKEGDILLVQVPRGACQKVSEALRQALPKMGLNRVHSLVLPNDFKVSAISAEGLAQLSARIENARVRAEVQARNVMSNQMLRLMKQRRRNPGDGQ